MPESSPPRAPGCRGDPERAREGEVIACGRRTAPGTPAGPGRARKRAAPRAPPYLAREVGVRSRGRGSAGLARACAARSPLSAPPRSRSGSPRRSDLQQPAPGRVSTLSSRPAPAARVLSPPSVLRRAPLLPLLFIRESGGPSPSLPSSGACTHRLPQKRVLLARRQRLGRSLKFWG